MTPTKYQEYGIAPDYKEDKNSKGIAGYLDPFFEGGSDSSGLKAIVGCVALLIVVPIAKITIEYPLRFTANGIASLRGNLPIYKSTDHRARAKNIAEQCEKRLEQIRKITNPKRKAKALKALEENLKFHKKKTTIIDRIYTLDTAIDQVIREQGKNNTPQLHANEAKEIAGKSTITKKASFKQPIPIEVPVRGLSRQSSSLRQR